MKRKELFWMLLPCLALVCLAVALRNRPGATLVLNEPFAAVVEKVEKETLMPREVADGWDTKFKITLNHKGPAPQWWGQAVDDTGSSDGARLFYEHEGKQSAVNVPQINTYGNYLLWRPRWDEESKRYVARLLLPLAKVPPHAGNVKVQARLEFAKNNTPLCPPARLEHIVRRPGEVVRVPQVSKQSPLRIEQTIVDEVPPTQRKVNSSAGSTTGNTQVTWQVRYSGTDETTHYGIGVEVFLYDEHGASYTPENAGGGAFVSKQRTTSTATADFDLSKIPRSAGALTVRGNIGIGSYWPLTINVPLRDKQGRILKTPLAAAPFTVTYVAVRRANDEIKKEYGADTVVSIGIDLTKQPGRVSYEDWRADWSPHLVDENGKEYWLFMTPNPVGPQPLGFGLSTSEGTEHSIQYFIPLSQVPLRAKTLKFRTQIGYKHSKRVPVEVLMRKNGTTQFTSQEPWS